MWPWRRPNAASSRSVAAVAPAVKPTIGSADYWRVLLEETRLTRDRQDARYGRLEVSAGVVLAAAATIGLARFTAPRAVDWVDALLVVSVVTALSLALSVIWPRTRPSFDPDETRLAIQAVQGRDAGALIGGLYKDARRANIRAEEQYAHIYRRFRVALIAVAIAAMTLLIPTLIAMFLSGEVPADAH